MIASDNQERYSYSTALEERLNLKKQDEDEQEIQSFLKRLSEEVQITYLQSRLEGGVKEDEIQYEFELAVKEILNKEQQLKLSLELAYVLFDKMHEQRDLIVNEAHNYETIREELLKDIEFKEQYIGEYQKRVQFLSEHNDQLSKELALLELQNEQMKQRNTLLDQELFQSLQNFKEMKQDKETTQNKMLSAISQEIKNLKAQNSELLKEQAEFKKRAHKQDEQSQECFQTIEQLQMLLQSAKKEIETSSKRLKEMEEMQYALQTYNQKLEQDVTTLEIMHQKELENHTEIIKDQYDQINFKESQIQKTNEKPQNSQSTKTDAQKEALSDEIPENRKFSEEDPFSYSHFKGYSNNRHEDREKLQENILYKRAQSQKQADNYSKSDNKENSHYFAQSLTDQGINDSMLSDNDARNSYSDAKNSYQQDHDVPQFISQIVKKEQLIQEENNEEENQEDEEDDDEENSSKISNYNINSSNVNRSQLIKSVNNSNIVASINNDDSKKASRLRNDNFSAVSFSMLKSGLQQQSLIKNAQDESKISHNTTFLSIEQINSKMKSSGIKGVSQEDNLNNSQIQEEKPTFAKIKTRKTLFMENMKNYTNNRQKENGIFRSLVEESPDLEDRNDRKYCVLCHCKINTQSGARQSLPASTANVLNLIQNYDGNMEQTYQTLSHNEMKKNRHNRSGLSGNKFSRETTKNTLQTDPHSNYTSPQVPDKYQRNSSKQAQLKFKIEENISNNEEDSQQEKEDLCSYKKTEFNANDPYPYRNQVKFFGISICK